MRPYIGVTGLMTRAEADAVVTLYRDAWASVGGEPTHDLMLGVLASTKTLTGEANKYPLRYPKLDDLNGVFPCHRTGTEGAERHACGSPKADAERFGVVRLLHCAVSPDNVYAPLKDAEWNTGVTCDGFQINCLWPDLAQLKHFRQDHPHVRIVLQVPPRALADLAWAPDAIADAVRPYAEAGLITDVLIDWSGGRGVELQGSFPLWLDDMGKRQGPIWEVWVRLNMLGLKVGFAGGLSAETLAPMGPLFRWGFDVSIDAEGKLRDDAPGGGNLDLDKVRRYLVAAVRMVGGRKG